MLRQKEVLDRDETGVVLNVKTTTTMTRVGVKGGASRVCAANEVPTSV